MATAQGYKSREMVIKNIPVVVTTYQIGEIHYCHVTNKDPGATIARAEGKNADEARKLALAKCESRL